MNRLIWLAAVAIFGCGTPATNNDNSDNDSGNANNVNNANNMSDMGVNNINNGEACEPLQDEFKTAVRALPRDCASDAECSLALRAGPCDCAISVSGSDLTEYDAARQSLDDNECRNPFVCIGNKCDQYRILSDPGELIPKCTGNECEVVQLLSCTDFENAKNGGLISESSCVTDADCTLRTDLNPCNCQEAVGTSFPLLAGQTIRELIDLNTDRCGTVCEGCPVINGVSCVDEGDVKRCRTN